MDRIENIVLPATAITGIKHQGEFFLYSVDAVHIAHIFSRKSRGAEADVEKKW